MLSYNISTTAILHWTALRRGSLEASKIRRKGCRPYHVENNRWNKIKTECFGKTFSLDLSPRNETPYCKPYSGSQTSLGMLCRYGQDCTGAKQGLLRKTNGCTVQINWMEDFLSHCKPYHTKAGRCQNIPAEFSAKVVSQNDSAWRDSHVVRLRPIRYII